MHRFAQLVRQSASQLQHSIFASGSRSQQRTGRITSQIVILSLFVNASAVFCTSIDITGRITRQIVILSLFVLKLTPNASAVFCIDIGIGMADRWSGECRRQPRAAELTSKRDDEQATWLAASGTQPAATTARCAELF